MKEYVKGVLLRVFIDENSRSEGRPLYEAIVRKARETGLAGATVLKGVMGYGAGSAIHTTKVLRLSEDLPMIIEIVDSRDKINLILPYLDEHVNEGLITMEEVSVIKYHHDRQKD
jgi:PII-like signaling protein